jgi:DNA-binding NarL/FixJ family response regulator
MAGRKTVLIVDDHALFREGLKGIINRDPDYAVVGETGRADSALRLARSLRPQLVLVDIALPDQSGIELAGQLRKILPETAVMMVTMHSKVDYIVNAFQAGATGYVTKNSAPERLLQAMGVVLKGEYFLDSAVSQKVVERLAGLQKEPRPVAGAGWEALTAREQEVFVLLAEGRTLKQIAERLFISPKTVENHRTRIMRKLNLHSSVELIRCAARVGVIDLELWRE